jgi:hypothetical protein
MKLPDKINSRLPEDGQSITASGSPSCVGSQDENENRQTSEFHHPKFTVNRQEKDDNKRWQQRMKQTLTNK